MVDDGPQTPMNTVTAVAQQYSADGRVTHERGSVSQQ